MCVCFALLSYQSVLGTNIMISFVVPFVRTEPAVDGGRRAHVELVPFRSSSDLETLRRRDVPSALVDHVV